jgi:polyphosphate kinase
MTRNLDRRVEVVVPVLDAQAKTYLKDAVLAAYLRDNVKARVMNFDGTYEQPAIGAGEELFNSQLFFEGPNSSPAIGSVHPLKRQRLWAKQ